MHHVSKIALAVAGLCMAAQAGAEITLYEKERYQGRSFSASESVENLRREGFFERASSVVVNGDRQDRWEVCEDSRLRGRCTVLRPGQYGSLAALGLGARVTSVRQLARSEQVADSRYAPQATVAPMAPVPTAPAPQTLVQFDLYESDGFRGRSFSTRNAVADMRQEGMNDRGSSAVVTGANWEVCQDTRYAGPCTVLQPGQYPSLASLGLGDRISSVRAVPTPVRSNPAPAAPAAESRVVFFENESFQGRAFTAQDSIEDFRNVGFNDRASSIVVTGQRWQVCQDARYAGSCTVLRPGQYPSLQAMGLNDRISSLRPLGREASDEGRRYAPLPLVSHDYGRRGDERLYEARITSVRAVVEDSGQRCWVEREQAAPAQRGSTNVPGALLGAVLGGILGHQVGGGSGKDIATGVGVVAGAAIGGNVGRGAEQQVVQGPGVQRCTTTPGQAHPAYWDVTYNFRGQDYRVQMNRQPGDTVTVNEQGEPRA